jgi:methylated-DNA-protein-cysteine methyltransferase-like protein
VETGGMATGFRDDYEPRIVGPGFRARVYALVHRVPGGQVTTYGDVATLLGSPRVARQVGWALAALPPDTDVPWHRVINAQGRVSHRGDTIRATEQYRRLEGEGVHFSETGICDLHRLRWEHPEPRS